MVFPVQIEGSTVVVDCADGTVTQEHVVDTLVMFLNEAPTYRGKRLLIIDPGSDYNPSREELRQFVGLITALLEVVFPRIALVIGKALHYGLGRMTESLAESDKGVFCVFKDREAAQTWLDS